MPASAIERQFPDDARQHAGHSFEGIRQELFEPGNAYRRSWGEKGLVDGHDNDEVSIMSEERPALEGVEMIAVVVVAEFVNARDAIKFMQRFQCNPDALLVFSEELLDIWIVSVTRFHISNSPIVVGSYNLLSDHINKTLVGFSFNHVL